MKFCIFILFAISLIAQPGAPVGGYGGAMVGSATNPNGTSCTAATAVALLFQSSIYTCQGGTYQLVSSSGGSVTYCADASASTTTYTCPTPTPSVSSLTTGLYVTFVPQTTNTATSTLNISNLGAKTLKQADGATNVIAGALVGGQAYFFTYNGTNLVQTNNGINTSTQLSDTANIVYTNQNRTMAAVLSIPGGDLFNGGVNAQSGTSYTIASTDGNKLITFNNAAAVAVTLPQAGSAGFASGFFSYTFNRGAGSATITPTTSTINGGATLVLATNQGALIESDGSNYSAWLSANPSGTGSAATTVTTTFSATPTYTCPSSTSGTVVDFLLSTALTANITSSTLSTCTSGALLNFRFVQDATGGRTVVMPTGFEACFVNPAANAGTKCSYFWDGTNGRLISNTGDTGYSAGSCVSAPGTPPVNDFFSWCDSTTNVFSFKANNSATISSTVVPSTAPASQFANSIGTNGVIAFAQPLLSGLGAAGASNTIANGNNPQTWNWAQTTDAQDAITIGETSAATGGTLTNALANQALFHIQTLTGSTETPAEIEQVSVNGATGPPLLQLESTWNNASLVGKGLVVSITNTASAVGSKPLQTLVGNVEQFSADKSGNVVAATSLQTTNTAPAITAGTGGAIGISEGTAATGLANVDVCYGDSVLHAVKCSYNNGTFFQIPQEIVATSAAFATATTAGTCVQNTTAVTNAATTMAVAISPVSTPGVGAVWSAFVSSAGNVTINECAVATSAGGTIAFNIRVIP